MIMYSDFLSVNKNFQSSVNLELDYGKLAKIDEYIPTKDICDVIKKYVRVALGDTKDYATYLVGPYGKGKSFLLLVLSFIFSKNKDKDTRNRLLKKIQAVDEELYNLLLKVEKKRLSLVPVIINSNYDNLSQSFRISLKEALNRVGLEKVTPKSSYDVCISLLAKWEKAATIHEKASEKCIEVNKIDLKSLKRGLQEYSPKAYSQFEKLYNCVNIGLNFNPLIDDDILKVYSSVADAIKSENYTGFFIIFDEFSKFLESNSSNLMRDLKLIQDMAELSNRSNKEKQIHLCCVSHKSILLYYSARKQNSNALDSFKAVEGRFKEIRFNRSLEENYQIIASAIRKSEDSYNRIDSELEKKQSLYDQLNQLSFVTKDEKIKDLLFKGCFPLNPMTTYALIHLSEYVAQNERTLFTFLSDSDDDSLNSFIKNNDSGLFNVDKIFDYFSDLLKKEDSKRIKQLWYRAESILTKVEEPNSRRIIKCISVFLMINDSDKLPCNEDYLSMATNLKLSDVQGIINDLIEQHLIRKNLLNNLITFAFSGSRQIDEEIELYKKTKFKNLKYETYLSEVNEQKFLLPRKYNTLNKITRFFKVEFMSEPDFLAVKSFNYYFEQNFCDGLVIYLLANKTTNEEIKKKLNSLSDDRVVIVYPSVSISDVFYSEVLQYACLEELLNKKGIGKTEGNEIRLLLDEAKSDIQYLINEYYQKSRFIYAANHINNQNLNSLLSDLMETNYPKSVIFNNELVNKNTLSTQYQKAVNHVVDYILNGDSEFPYVETSPEGTTYAAIVKQVNNSEISKIHFLQIISEIEEEIKSNAGSKISISKIVAKYMNRPYGIRKGVMPILFAKAIANFPDDIVLYYEIKEIDLNSENIVKAIDNEKYLLRFSERSNEQKKYLNRLMKLFSVESSMNFRKDTSLVANKIKKFLMNLPQAVRVSNSSNNFLGLSEDFITFKTFYFSFVFNPYDVVYNAPKKAFKTKDYKAVFSNIQSIASKAKELINPFKEKLINEIKKLYLIDQNTSLKMGLSKFIDTSVEEHTKPVLEETSKALFELIKDKISYDDYEALDQLSKITTKQYIEDWEKDKSQLLIDTLNSFKTSVLSKDLLTIKTNSIDLSDSSSVELTGTAILLKNNMESILDEFSGGVTTVEKVEVLKQLLKNLL